jgi:cobalamin biosynthesis Mg chelatase CobN
MQGAPRRSARSFFVLPLVLALLAFVALPGFASAGEIPQYEVEKTESFETTQPTKESPKPKHNSPGNTGKTTEPTAHASETTNGGESSSGEKEPEESTEKEKSQSSGGGAPTNNGGGGNGGGESSKPSNGGGGSKDGIGSQEVAGGGTGTPPVHKTETSSGGGSSPVVPILIAVIVLAAISIGVVLYRQRKSGGQGPDRRVSSPNAS